MTVLGATKFERFFRLAASLDIGKQDVKRYTDFVNHKIHDLLLRAEATAKANGRDVVDPQDLPITKGLQECIPCVRKAPAERRVQSHPGPHYGEAAARPGLEGRDGGHASQDQWWLERSTRTHFQTHRTGHQRIPRPRIGSAHFRFSTCCCSLRHKEVRRWLISLVTLSVRHAVRSTAFPRRGSRWRLNAERVTINCLPGSL